MPATTTVTAFTSDLPTLPELPGLSRENDVYPLTRVLVQNSRARAEFVCAARCARVIARDARFVRPAARIDFQSLVEISQISYKT